MKSSKMPKCCLGVFKTHFVCVEMQLLFTIHPDEWNLTVVCVPCSVLESWLDYTGELEPPEPLARLPQLKHRIRQLLTDLGTVQKIALCSSSTWGRQSAQISETCRRGEVENEKMTWTQTQAEVVFVLWGELRAKTNQPMTETRRKKLLECLIC